MLKDQYGFEAGCLDFLFVDHDKKQYLSDLKLMMKEGWLREGSVVVGDNILAPGVPDYRAYFKSEEGAKQWETVEHETCLEYSNLKDMVLESTCLHSATLPNLRKHKVGNIIRYVSSSLDVKSQKL